MNRSIRLFPLAALALSYLSVVPLAMAQTTYTINTGTLNATTAAGVHPRLFVTTTKLASVKSAIQSPPANTRWDDMWVSFKNRADMAAITVPPPYAIAGANDPMLWQRAVGDNMGILAAAQVLTKASLPANDTIWIEAEDAVLTSPMTTGSDPAASGGTYISTPVGGATNHPNALPPSATYYFSSQSKPAYHVFARVFAPSSSSCTFYTNIDGQTETSTYVTTTGSWVWIPCGDWTLTPGNHVMNVTYENQGLQIDKFYLSTNWQITPSGLGTEQRWLEAENFALNANGTGGTNNLVVTSKDTTYSPNGDQLAHGGPLSPLGDPLVQSRQVFQEGVWLESPSATSPNGTQPVAGAVPDAQQSVNLNGGVYDIWVRLKAPAQGHDSFYFAIDSSAYSACGVDSTCAWPYSILVPASKLYYNSTLSSPYNSYPYQEWVWKKVANNVTLAAGVHTLNVSNGASGCMIDRFLINPAGTAAPTEPNKYLASELRWMAAATDYPEWGDGTQANDLVCAHELMGLSLLYDWCYSFLDATDQQRTSSKVVTMGSAMNTAASTPYANGGAWWYGGWLLNHCWVSETGLTTAAIAFRNDTSTDTTPWLNTSLFGMNNALNDLGADGADQEGPAYWGYGISWILQYLDMAKTNMAIANSAGQDMYSTPWLNQTALYRQYFDLPANGEVGMDNVNFSDDKGYDWDGPDYFLRRLAAQYRVPYAQWLAEKCDQLKLNNQDLSTQLEAGMPWGNLFYYDPTVPETDPGTYGLPTLGYFGDLDFAVSRSGWDGTESLVAFQCGPPAGHTVQAIVKPPATFTNLGENHCHPEAGHFCIFGYGDWIVQNDGYTTAKKTSYGNTLLVGGAGQNGEGSSEFTPKQTANEDSGKFDPAIDDTLSYSSPGMDYLVGDADQAYPSASKVTKFRRHLLYLKPDVLVVVDDVALSVANSLELRFYPGSRSTTYTQSGSTYKTTRMHSVTNFNVLTAPTQTAVTVKNDSTTQSINCYSLATTSALTSMSTAVSFAWCSKPGTPKAVTYLADSDGTAWKFKVGGSTMVLDRNAGHALDEKSRLVQTIEAESVTPNSPMQVYTDSTASGGNYIATPVGTTPNLPSDGLAGPSASYTFTAPATGSYVVWARVQAADSTSNSFWFAMDPTGSTAYTLASTSTYGSWVWVQMTASPVTLTAGTNTLGLKYASANCKIDQVIVTSDPSYVPYGVY